MIVVLAVIVVVLVLRGLAKRRTAKAAELGANQAAQQVHSPYAALYHRDTDGIVGRLLNTFFRGGGF